MDIAERLRQSTDPVCHEAADEIEELRKVIQLLLESAMANVETMHMDSELLIKMYAEIRDLRARVG